MKDFNIYPDNNSSIWIQNLIGGISGITIKVKNYVFCGASPFQKIEVFDTYAFGRILCLGGNIVMTESDDAYNEMMVHPAMLMHKNPKKVCCIGGGDGGCLRELLKYDCVEKIVIVDIDKVVHETVITFFPSFAEGFKDPRVELIIDDGYKFLKSIDTVFDIILIDSYDPGGPVQSLETEDFHRLLSLRLDEEGIAVVQTDSPFRKASMIYNTINNISHFFRKMKPYIGSVSFFPDGICSFIMCVKREEIFENFNIERYKEIENSCNYFNADIHKGAFLLPQSIKRVFNSN